MHRVVKSLLIGLLALGLAAAPTAAAPDGPKGKPAHAGGPGKGNGQGAKGGGPPAGVGPGERGSPRGWDDSFSLGDFVAAGFTAAVLRELVGPDLGLLQIGAKPLPPGIAKNLARGKPLPPGIARNRVGGPLLARLPRVDGHEWLRVGTELVLVAVGTLIVREIIRDVFD